MSRPSFLPGKYGEEILDTIVSTQNQIGLGLMEEYEPLLREACPSDLSF